MKKDIIFAPIALALGIALISGIVIKNVRGIAALSILHKAGAAVFVVLLIVLFVHKLATAKQA